MAGDSEALRLRVEREIVEQHHIFVGWYNGRLGDEGFAAFEGSLAPSFTMVTTSGKILDRPTVIGFVRANGGSEPGTFEIAIEDVKLAYQGDGVVSATYFEVQHRGGVKTRRVSSAVFSRDETRTTGLVWQHLHETWT